ncbi:ParA family protein [Pararhizobium antarcticum]|uniref:Chromosome partitioning protein ParA n=1 Tax=Pararhizobium antarcticum TaxID=1798805 RepID=A0A657LQK7_9HYPH|nr:ParA family protein [Pararhizobium antarcticum]OJF95308.1 chromosome partitioning protein ParA [Pararhizobium antarcticum]OJF96328.1 chromosome partitioning protein ParA [Rhizobium sp. 58]
MPVITFANTKGGAGKTTAVLLVATELLRQGFRVAILDADPQHWITQWYEKSNAATLAGLSVVSYVTHSTIDKHVRDYRDTVDYVLVDLPGARNTLLAKAIGYSDHVIIPVQGSAMDAQGGAHVIELLQYLKMKGDIRIAHSVVLTRVNSMVTTRALQSVKELLAARHVNVLDTPIIERSAFRDIFGCGGTLYTMDTRKVSNLDKARENAETLAREIIRLVPAKTVAAVASQDKLCLQSAA